LVRVFTEAVSKYQISLELRSEKVDIMAVIQKVFTVLIDTNEYESQYPARLSLKAFEFLVSV
jgi:hypothetical protein